MGLIGNNFKVAFFIFMISSTIVQCSSVSRNDVTPLEFVGLKYVSIRMKNKKTMGN